MWKQAPNCIPEEWRRDGAEALLKAVETVGPGKEARGGGRQGGGDAVHGSTPGEAARRTTSRGGAAAEQGQG